MKITKKQIEEYLRSNIDTTLIDFALDVIEQWGCLSNDGKRYYHGGLSTLENAHSILYKSGVIQDFDFVYISEIEKYVTEHHESNKETN